MTPSTIKRLGAAASLVGGVLWLLLWAHFLVTHGTTAYDLKRRLFGLTWLDTDKLVVIPMLLFMVGLVGVRAWQKASSSRLGTAGYVIALVCSFLVIIGQALLYWPVPWGSYPPESFWNNPFTQLVAVPLALLPAVLLSLGLLLFGVDLLRRKPLPQGNALPLLLGLVLFTTPWLRDTVQAALFGLGWGALGYVLWRPARPSPARPSLAAE